MSLPESRPGYGNPAETEKEIPRDQKVRQILESTGAVLTESHFVYTSGRHGDAYINKDAVYPHTREISDLCRMFAEDFKDKGVEVVAAPAVGGVILSHETASHLTKMTEKDILGVYAEKQEDGNMEFRRGYADLIKGKRVLVVEDVLTTGGSVLKTIKAVEKSGGTVIGLGAICNRGGVKPEDIGVEAIDALINVQMESYPEEDCKQCKAGVPIDSRVGKGKEYLLKKQSHTS